MPLDPPRRPLTPTALEDWSSDPFAGGPGLPATLTAACEVSSDENCCTAGLDISRLHSGLAPRLPGAGLPDAPARARDSGLKLGLSGLRATPSAPTPRARRLGISCSKACIAAEGLLPSDDRTSPVLSGSGEFAWSGGSTLGVGSGEIAESAGAGTSKSAPGSIATLGRISISSDSTAASPPSAELPVEATGCPMPEPAAGMCSATNSPCRIEGLGAGSGVGRVRRIRSTMSSSGGVTLKLLIEWMAHVSRSKLQ
mmetsp:Transcript_15716/g.37940  ORF Transcript_15716/g.37940 Transcript_15716/m.37940 type:complete len:255 (-) Transcript_15716:534-1298(-)